jgi:methylenetetrahydrofolate reductase (NADPH)
MISFELVPRNIESINQQLAFIEKLNFIDSINVPDLKKLSIRSWDVSVDNKYTFIPHIRAVDFNLKEAKLFELIESRNLKNILVISGESNYNENSFNTSSVDVITAIKDRYPHIIVSAGFDQYRGSLKSEEQHIKDKLSAGADYLMSQPFFDKNLLEIYLDIIPPEKIFIGISPVVTEKSKAYWENINSVVFPKNFDLSYDWNIDYANEILELSKYLNSNIYFMPIVIDLEKYFSEIQYN